VPTVIDLFAGCGGLTAGFVRHGYTPVLAVEHNLHAAATYALNFGEAHTRWGDVAALDAVPQADVVIGGPPCQASPTWAASTSTTRATGCGGSSCASWRPPARRCS